MKTTLHVLLALLLLIASIPNAFADCEEDKSDCVAVGQWDFSLGLGVGARSNPIAENDDIPIFLLPAITYYGERFFWETDTIGFTLSESHRHMFNIIGTISYDQTFFNEWGVGNFAIEGGVSSGRSGGGFAGDPAPTQTPAPQPTPTPAETPLPDSGLNFDLTLGGDAGADDPDEAISQEDIPDPVIDVDDLHDRELAALMGFEYAYYKRGYGLSLQALQDVSGVHNGKQVRLSLSKELYFTRNAFELSIGGLWKDSKTLDYYFGVREDEVADPRFAYVVKSDTSYFAKLDWRYRISKKWELRTIIHHRWMADNVVDSPIVEKDTVLTGFIGGVYHF